MIYAARVKSPLKGGVDVKLGPKTVLVGPNGAGKTAVLQALKLGTAGYVDDQEGRDGVATTAAIARLFPVGAPLQAEVEMSDGVLFTWASKKKGRGFSKPKATTKERPYRIHYPFQSIRALLSGDDKKIRAWLEKKVGSSLSQKDLVELLPPLLQEDAKEVLREFSERAPVELAAALKGSARNLRAGATRKEKTIDRLVEGVPLPLSAKEVEELQERGEVLWSQAHAPNIMSSAEHQQLREKIVSLAGVLEQVEDQITELPEAEPGEAETADIAVKAHALTRAHLVQLGHDVCYVCLRKGAEIQRAFDRWAGVLSKLGHTSSRQRLQAQYSRGRAEIEQLAEAYRKAQVADVGPVMEEHSTVKARLATHDANKRVWSQAEALRKEVASDRAVADLHAALGRTWESEGKELLLQRKEAFEAGVTDFLPGGEVFSVDLEAGRVGLERDGRIHTSLSGAETARVLLAVLSFESDLSDGSTPSILEPEDRGWDPDTLADVMTALTGAPDQVILMSTVVPSRTPEGWSIIEV
ncbi:hypothetical protein CMI37_19020 [Candidatus Pacearchaeota archaeon]|nr:hypothetical protein [Candidatus Pacearchaeota archaeon]